MKKKIIFLCLLFIIGLAIRVLINFPQKYYNKDFNIQDYHSLVDFDNDLIDDQTDILQNAKKYVALKPKYKSKYYSGGYSNDNYGVCSDVVANALLKAGYDLKELVAKDIKANRSKYNIKQADKNIDFRRVVNLIVYFKNTAIKLTNDPYDIKNWQGGDIVIFNHHIGIVSNIRNKKGIAYVIHHKNPFQTNYEEDILTKKHYKIIGHYRVS